MNHLKTILEMVQKRPKATILLTLFAFLLINLFFYITTRSSFDNFKLLNGLICFVCIATIYALNAVLNGFLPATKALPMIMLILSIVQLANSSSHTHCPIIVSAIIIALCSVIYKIYHCFKYTHYSVKKFITPKQTYKVSAVIPNYNYANYLETRIQSILSQKYPIYELIILDDASTDNSDKIIKGLINRIKKERPEIITKYIPNQTNSGNVFRQWEKCFTMSSGDFVWICEADDSCSKYFLNSVMRPFEDKDVVLSYAESRTINENGDKELHDLRPWIDIFNTRHWDKSYINEGKDELRNYTSVNNTIANASGVVFRRIDIPYKEYFKQAQKFRLAGDWYFYSKYLLYGKIAYNSESLNYHRMHSKGVTLSTDKFKQYNEIKEIQKSIQKEVKISKLAAEHIKEYDKITMDGFGICKKELYYANKSLSDLLSKRQITDKTLLSIIVSAYNAEEYIEACLSSVKKALPEKTEVLIVDDGSTDKTAKIIKAFINNTPHMKYYYKKNGGLSSVKNFGLSKACGKYIIFMDADDEIKPNGYLTMLKNAIDKDADIVVCDMELINESNGSINYPVYHKDYKGAKAYLVDGLMASSNNKMIKKSLYDKVGNYPEGKNNEDVAVTPVLLTMAKKIEYIHSSFYRYYQREGSIQHTKFNINRLVIFDTVKQAIDSVKKLAPSEADTISGIIICNQLIALLIYIIYPMNDNKLKYQIIKEFSNRYKNLDTQNNKYIKDYCTEIGLSNLQDRILHSSPRKICLYIKWSHFTDYLKRAFGIKK